MLSQTELHAKVHSTAQLVILSSITHFTLAKVVNQDVLNVTNMVVKLNATASAVIASLMPTTVLLAMVMTF